jgi:hypothetical protein
MGTQRGAVPDPQPGQPGGRLSEQRGDVRAAVVGRGEQQRQHHHRANPGGRPPRPPDRRSAPSDGTAAAVSLGQCLPGPAGADASLVGECAEHLQWRGRGVAEERGPGVQPRWCPLARQREEFADCGAGPGIPAAVGDCDERGSQVWMPHSVLPVPIHRPLRGSAPGATFLVQVAQPMDGYPSYTSGLTSTPLSAM